MQADLDIHCSDVRLREGLAVGGGSGIRTLDLSPSNGYSYSKFNSASSYSAKFFFLARPNRKISCIVQIAAVVYAASQAKSQINYDCPTLTVQTLVCVCTEYESK
ncbi:hypothetical protein T06_473 [Trichinella sp. T6]|nr:hypothetical protein T06_473 [Trichinella sp. T6]